MKKTKPSDHFKSEVKERSDRKRYLNIIYFVDSNRTRTLKFSIGASYVTVGLIAAALVWSLVSTTLLVRDRYVIAGMSDHTTRLLELVFNHQTRYDEVYEKAYPDNDAALLVDETEPEKAEKPVEKRGIMSLSAKRPPMPVTPPAARSAIDKLAEESSSAKRTLNAEPVVPSATPKVKSGDEPPLSIDNFSTTMTEKSLIINLSLKNLSSPNKTSGSVSAVAKYIDAADKSYALESHPRDTGDEASGGEHFNIRYFKNKAFYFEPPKDVMGRFHEVVVTIKDAEGHSKDFLYPLNKESLARYQKEAVNDQRESGAGNSSRSGSGPADRDEETLSPGAAQLYPAPLHSATSSMRSPLPGDIRN